MKSISEADRLLKSLFNQEVFGTIINPSLSKLDDRDDPDKDRDDLEDGSRAIKQFIVLDDVCWPEQSVAPTKVRSVKPNIS